jgi:Tol biopolymer transport system component
MGEVYRARDTKLEREVAVKVLPQRLAEDATALARFEREAKAVAALAHPNILAIYDFGTAAGVTYAVMELLDGQTLRARLEEGPLPPRKAAELARQVAGALGAAHGRGIVHRDLKPENIFVGHDGRAKVLDFGLAGERGGAGSTVGITGSDTPAVGPTRTSLTTPGTVMGTVGYMAPEQVRGEPADHRADLFSFGCVLYEMLTGVRAFSRETAAESMTAILREEPPEPETSNPAVTPALGRVVRRCLEKRPDERFQSAQDLAFAIDNSMSISGVDSGGRETLAVAGPAPRRRVGWPVVTAIGLIGLLIGFGIAQLRRPTAEPADLARVRTLTVSGRDSEPSASPDGQIVAFSSSRDGTSRIWIKQLATGGEEPLTEGPDGTPRFSPDGSTLLFLRDEGRVASIYRQSLIGGQQRKLVEDAVDACWAPDGSRIAFLRIGTEGGRRIGFVGVADAQEGNERIVYEAPTGMYGVRWSPDGRTLAMVEASVTGNNPDYHLLMIDVESGAAETLRPGTGHPLSSPVWTGDGALVLAESSSLLGDQGDTLSRFMRYDPRSDETRTLFWTQDVFPLQGIRSDFTQVDIVRPGTVVFHRTRVRQRMREIELGGTGRVADERVLTRGEGRDRQPTYSPDGRRVLFSSNRSGNLDLWTLDLVDGALRQLTDDAAQDWDPGFTPDGRQIVWSSDRGGHLEIWIANADGSGARQVTQDGLDAENPTVTRDGEWVVYWSANPDKVGVWKIRTDGTEATHLVEGAYLQPDLSPDGRYASFVSLEIDTLLSVVEVVDVETGELVPFRVEVPSPLQSTNIIFGRTRWLPDGSAVAWVGIDEQGRSGIYAQDFVPGKDTSATRRPLAGFSADYTTESFGISPNGTKVTLATLEQTIQLMLAEEVPGVSRGSAR